MKADQKLFSLGFAISSFNTKQICPCLSHGFCLLCPGDALPGLDNGLDLFLLDGLLSP